MNLMSFAQPVSDLVRKRYSCRAYQNTPLDSETRQKMENCLASLITGPLGNTMRFKLAAATEEDRKLLSGLGTYGFIKDPAAFIIGAIEDAPHALEDFGYQMEVAVLSAADLGLGSCWLGGSFTRSSFAKKITASETEDIPAVCSLGYPSNGNGPDVTLREKFRAKDRKPFEELFCDKKFTHALQPEAAGEFQEPLEAVRLAPSASNQQPWRVLKDGSKWHFYLKRTQGYRDKWVAKLLGIEDLQRVDMGIAMCHFGLSVVELGLPGHWESADPGIAVPDELTEYTISWIV
jgi:nitroreductase